MMSLDRFAALVDAYGASPARWPEGERAAAAALMKASADARRMAAEADALDRMLDATQTAPATRALQDRILASVAGRAWAVGARSFRFAVSRWLPAGAIACSLMLGAAIGSQVPALAGVDDEALAQAAASSALTASASDSDMWVGEVE